MIFVIGFANENGLFCIGARAVLAYNAIVAFDKTFVLSN